MQMLFVAFGFLAVVSAQASLPHTESFKSHLHGLSTKGGELQQCLKSVTHPLAVADHFAKDVAHVMDILHRLEGRVETVNDVIEAVMLIPYVGAFAAPVLGPTTAVISAIDNALKSILRSVDKVVHVITGWLKPIQAIEHRITIVLAKMAQIVKGIQLAEAETKDIEQCLVTLPNSVQPDAVDALEKVTGALEIIPRGVEHAVGVVNGGCQKIQGFLHHLHIIKRKRSLPSFHDIIHVLERIDGALGPVGHFLDVVHNALNKRICLIADLIKIGGVVVHGVDHLGKEVVKDAEQLGQEIAHETEHIAKEIAHTATDLGSKIVHTAEHVGQEIVHTAIDAKNTLVHVGNQIAHTAETIEHQVVHTAVDVGNKIAHGATDVGHAIEHTAVNVGNQIAHTAVDVGNQVAHTATDVANKVGGFFKHLFGRRSEIDGRYYVIVDNDFQGRKRGADICFSIHGALNFVNGVTHGMLGEAQKFIGGLFKGRSAFHVPALTRDVYHLPDMLAKYHMSIPEVSHLLTIAGREVNKFLSIKPVDEYIKAVPSCKAAINRLHG